MNDADKAAIRARLAAATPGPWAIERAEWTEMGRQLLTATWLQPVDLEVSEIAAGDAALIAHAPVDLTTLLAALDEAERERGELRALLAKQEGARMARRRATGPTASTRRSRTSDDPRRYTHQPGETMTKPRPTLVARQGDVGILIHTPLAASVPVATDPDGSAVVARGEVTGHRHRFAAEDGVTLRSERADTAADRLLAEIGPGGATLLHEEHAPVQLPAGKVETRIQRQYQYGRARRVED